MPLRSELQPAHRMLMPSLLTPWGYVHPHVSANIWQPSTERPRPLLLCLHQQWSRRCDASDPSGSGGGDAPMLWAAVCKEIAHAISCGPFTVYAHHRRIVLGDSHMFEVSFSAAKWFDNQTCMVAVSCLLTMLMQRSVACTHPKENSLFPLHDTSTRAVIFLLLHVRQDVQQADHNHYPAF